MKKHLAYAALILGVLPASAPARDFGELTSYFQNVVVGPDDTARDVVCIYCSIHVSADIGVDLVAIGGDIEIAGKAEGDAEWLPSRLRRRGASAENSKPAMP